MQKQVAGKTKKVASTNGVTHNGGMQSSQLMKLFEAELKDIYWAEKALTTAIPKMIKNATSKELIAALQLHLLQTKEQVSRAEQIFNSIDMKPVAKKCLAMEGLIKGRLQLWKSANPEQCVMRVLFLQHKKLSIMKLRLMAH